MYNLYYVTQRTIAQSDNHKNLEKVGGLDSNVYHTHRLGPKTDFLDFYVSWIEPSYISLPCLPVKQSCYIRAQSYRRRIPEKKLFSGQFIYCIEETKLIKKLKIYRILKTSKLKISSLNTLVNYTSTIKVSTKKTLAQSKHQHPK